MMGSVSSSALIVRPWVEADLEQIRRVHCLSRREAYAGLVPADALARVTPEQQTSAWRARFATLPEKHAALVVEDNKAVVGFTLAQLDPDLGAELNAIQP